MPEKNVLKEYSTLEKFTLSHMFRCFPCMDPSPQNSVQVEHHGKEGAVRKTPHLTVGKKEERTRRKIQGSSTFARSCPMTQLLPYTEKIPPSLSQKLRTKLSGQDLYREMKTPTITEYSSIFNLRRLGDSR